MRESAGLRKCCSLARWASGQRRETGSDARACSVSGTDWCGHEDYAAAEGMDKGVDQTCSADYNRRRGRA